MKHFTLIIALVSIQPLYCMRTSPISKNTAEEYVVVRDERQNNPYSATTKRTTKTDATLSTSTTSPKNVQPVPYKKRKT